MQGFLTRAESRALRMTEKKRKLRVKFNSIFPILKFVTRHTN